MAVLPSPDSGVLLPPTAAPDVGSAAPAASAAAAAGRWLFDSAPAPSLDGIVRVPAARARCCDFPRRLLLYSGPGLLIAIGSVDPGNWSTNLLAGSGWGYSLLFVILVSSLVGLFLQLLSARLGVAGRRDLAQACRASLHPAANVALWFSAEVAMVATDLAEVIGFAVGFTLLTGAPLAAGVGLAAGDTLLLLALPAGGRHARIVEVISLLLVLTMAACFIVALAAAKPPIADVLRGYLPSAVLFQDGGATLVAVGILGATVMPHNLYLHSALAQQRVIDEGAAGEEHGALLLPPVDAAAAAHGGERGVRPSAANGGGGEQGAQAPPASAPAPAAKPPLPQATDAQSPMEASFALARALDGDGGSGGGSGGARVAAEAAGDAAGDAAAAAASASKSAPADVPPQPLAPALPPGIVVNVAAAGSAPPPAAAPAPLPHPRASVLQALSLSTADAAVSLLGALCINSAIVVLAGSALHPLVASGETPLAEAASLEGAYALLEPALGRSAAAVFAVALIAAGQSSTFTGTMAGQVVMEGFLRIKLRPWLRRLLTRAVAVVPAAIAVSVAGDAAVGSLLVFSQVTLAFQLPFAVVPLVVFASSRARLGPYAISAPVAAVGWAIALTIIGINLWLVVQLIAGTAGGSR